MTYIWVSIDEWLIIEKSSGNGLVTTGLSGCVGVALMTRNRCLMAHVSSACGLKNWRTYKPKLMEMIRSLKTADESVTEAKLVYSDDQETELALMLRGLIYYFENLHPTIIKDAGCIISTIPSRIPYRPRASPEFGLPVPATGSVTGLRGSFDPAVGRSALKSHTARALLYAGGRLDEKVWPHVLDAESEKD